MEMTEAGAGIKPAESSIDAAAAAAAKTKPKKTKMVRVKQEYIDGLLARRPIKPFPFIPEERILLQDPEEQEETRARQARVAALIKLIRDEEEDILDQYRVKGYAETEVKIEDVDEEGGGMGSVVLGEKE